MTEAMQIILEDWNHLVNIVERATLSAPPELSYVYRGQPDESWELTPSFHRYFQQPYLKSKVSLKPEELLKVETMAWKKFRSQAHIHVSTYIMEVIKSRIDWWTLMQHHHAPTRLLDWTESPYIAAYHACIKNFNLDGSIWLLHINTLERRMKEIHGNDYEDFPLRSKDHDPFFLKPDALHDVVVVGRDTKTDRIAAQQGLFTICRNICGDQHKIISDAISTENKEGHHCFVQLIIPSDLKTKFLIRLHAMNITASSLFPGLDGLGGSVNELVRMNTFNIK
jgi:hypothetical protein